MTADILEIFSSIQGEGIFLGAKQIFVRFKRCNMSCAFCDENLDRKAKRYSSLELMKAVKALENTNGPHHSISLTGGEPLLYAEFLKSFLKIVRKNRNFRSYLETNGKVIDLVDIVAMDFKLPSSTGERPFWTEHLEFLKIASRKKVFVKAVVTPDTVKGDVEKAVSLIGRMRKNIPLVLQPATPVKPHDKGVKKDTLLNFIEIGLKNDVHNIRVIPQIHKILSVK